MAAHMDAKIAYGACVLYDSEAKARASWGGPPAGNGAAANLVPPTRRRVVRPEAEAKALIYAARGLNKQLISYRWEARDVSETFPTGSSVGMLTCSTCKPWREKSYT